MKDKIDTQGMSGTTKKSSITKPNKPLDQVTPFPVKENKVFTDMERNELHEIVKGAIAEYLDDTEYLGRLNNAMRELKMDANVDITIVGNGVLISKREVNSDPGDWLDSES